MRINPSQKPKSQIAKSRQHLRGVSGADTALVFLPEHIAYPVRTIFDALVSAIDLQ